LASESGQGELEWLARHAAHPRERPARCAGPDRAAALTERKAIPGRQGVASVRSLDVALLPYCIQFPLDWEKNQKKGAGTGASTASGESCPVERPGWWCKPGALQVMAMCTPPARPDRRRYAAVPFTPRSRARASVRLPHRRALPMSTFRVAARVLGLAAL